MAKIPHDPAVPEPLTKAPGAPPPTCHLEQVPLDRIKPEPRAALRGKLREAAMKELVESVRKLGILNPPHLTPNGKMFEIAQGHRRVEAARRAESKEIPALVFDTLEEAQIWERVLDENVQREPLSKNEIALTCHKISGLRRMDYEKLAEKIGRGKRTIQRYLRVSARASPDVKNAFRDDQVTYTQALAIMRLPAEHQAGLLKEVIEKKLSVRDIDERVGEILREGRPEPEPAESLGRLPGFVSVREAKDGKGFVVELRARDRAGLLLELNELSALLRGSKKDLLNPAPRRTKAAVRTRKMARGRAK